MIGGLSLATGHVRMEYVNGKMNSSYVAAWGDFLGGVITAGVEYNFGSGDFSFLDAAAIGDLQNSAQPSEAEPHKDFTVQVPGDTGADPGHHLQSRLPARRVW